MFIDSLFLRLSQGTFVLFYTLGPRHESLQWWTKCIPVYVHSKVIGRPMSFLRTSLLIVFCQLIEFIKVAAKIFRGYNVFFSCFFFYNFGWIDQPNIRRAAYTGVWRNSCNKNICNVYPNEFDVRKCQILFSKFKSGNFDRFDSYRSGRPTSDNDAVKGGEGSISLSDIEELLN